MNKKSEFWNLPVEMHKEIFLNLDDEDLALLRGVCGHWKTIIESHYCIYLEMTNLNWEDFITKTTATKLRVRADDLTFPIYQIPQFPDFASRLRVLEFNGFIPMYNFANILRGCGRLDSLAILEMEMVNKKPSPENYIITSQDEGSLHLRKLNFCPPQWDVTLNTIITALDVIGILIQKNSLTELNISSEYASDVIINGIYNGIFGVDDLDLPQVSEKYETMKHIIKSQSNSLRQIRFNHLYNTLPKKPKIYIKFHSSLNSNVDFSIRKSCLFGCVEDYHGQHRRRLRREPELHEILLLYKTQFKMENLKIMFETNADLQKIQLLIGQNSKTLKTISIDSIEPIVGYCRLFDCGIFIPCLELEELTLKSDLNYRNSKVMNIDLLPSSITNLKLVGFIPSFSLEKVERECDEGWREHFQHLTKLTLDHLPWFFVGEIPVRVMELDNLRFLLHSLPKLRKLRLIALITNRFITLPMAQIVGLEIPTDPVSLELIQWCENGGDINQSISIRRKNRTDKINYTIMIED